MIRTNPSPRSHPIHEVSRRTHAFLDYVGGILLLLAAAVLPFHDPNMQTFSLAAGGFLLLYSVVTDYELSLLRFVPFAIHRGADLLIGILVAFSPIHFGLRDAPAILFIAVGAMLIYLAFCTRAEPGRQMPG